MAVRPRNRFDVFKRDGFQCQYCGRRVPDVTLEVDHIVPKAAGGKDTKDNLITACFECNRGKADKSLADGEPRPDYAERLAEMKERQRQVKSYYAHEQAIAVESENALDDLHRYWCRILGEDPTPFNRGLIRSYMKEIPIHEIREAMDVAAYRLGVYSRFGYLAGILRKALEARRG